MSEAEVGKVVQGGGNVPSEEAKRKAGKGCLVVLALFFGVPLLAVLIGLVVMPEEEEEPMKTRTSLTVSAEIYGDKWPLTVKSGSVYMVKNQALFMTYDTPDGKAKVYGINSVARDNFPPIDEIVRYMDGSTEWKMNFTFLADEAYAHPMDKMSDPGAWGE